MASPGSPPSDLSLPDAPIEQREWLIGGRIQHWDGPLAKIQSCLREAPIGFVPSLTEKEALDAVRSAVDAYAGGAGQWPTSPVAQRIKAVQMFASKMKEVRKDIVKLLMWEIAKSIDDCEKEFDRTIMYIQDTIDALKDADRIGSRFAIAGGIVSQIRRSPLGVVLCMGPYNYPLNETLCTLIPALIMGNVVVMKPPKMGVLLFRPLLAIFAESFPPGVINVLYGNGKVLIEPIIRSGDVNVLAFIGSAKVSNAIRCNHPKPNRLRCILGLDAKNPAIIFKDAELDLAARECALGALSFNGQRCTAIKVIFVEESVAAAFLPRLIASVNGMARGNPWKRGVTITPMAEGVPKLDYFKHLIADAEGKGAKIVNEGGGQVDSATSPALLTPAVLFPCNGSMQIMHEEQFGPIIPVATFSDVNHGDGQAGQCLGPLKWMHSSPWGQQAAVFTRSPALLGPFLDKLVNLVCRVNVNSQCQRGPDVLPFTGRKDSAEGTLSVSDALRVFSIRSVVSAKLGEVNEDLISATIREHTSSFLNTDFIF